MPHALRIAQKPAVSVLQACFEPDTRLPAQGLDPGNVKQLARCAVGFAGVKNDFAREVCDPGYRLGQFANAAVNAAAHIEVAERGAGVGTVGLHW